MTANGSQDLTPEQKAHYGLIVCAHSTKTQPVYCLLLDTMFRSKRWSSSSRSGSYMLDKVAEKAFLDWRPINERLLFKDYWPASIRNTASSVPFNATPRPTMQKKRRKKTRSTTSYRRSPRLFQNMTYLSLWAT